MALLGRTRAHRFLLLLASGQQSEQGFALVSRHGQDVMQHRLHAGCRQVWRR